MTILQINVCVGRGSTGRIAEQIGDATMSRGWDSYIAYGRGVGESSSKTIRIGSKIGVYFHALMTRITDRHGLFSTCSTKKLIKQIREIKPDIIHLHNIHGYYINYKVLFEYLRKSGIPVVWTLHDCWPMTGHCAYFDFANCKRWQTGCYDCPLLETYPRAKRDNSPYNYKTKRKVFTSLGEKLHLVPVSNWLAEIVQESFLKESHVSVIHNGINVEAFTPCDGDALCAKYDIAGKRVVLGVALPWSRRKGLHDFYKLHTLLPRDKYQIVLVGLSQQQIAELPEGIIALQRTHSVEELAQWYSLADVFLNATYEDNYPTTNLEAISCGTPVITYRTGGSPESVTPHTGRVVEQGDLEGVVKAIEELCAEDREEMRKRCREYAVAHFDKKECFSKYLDLYEKILSSR